MEKDEEERKSSDVTIATIRSTAKRESCMRILMFLNDNSDASQDDRTHSTITEISDGLDMDWGTCKNSLTKLTESGFIELVEDKMDARCRYYRILDKKAVEKANDYYRIRQAKMKKREEETKYKPKVEPEVKAKQTEVEEVF